MRLEKFLEAKPLYYDEIDYTRMPRVYEKIKFHFTLKKIIHLVGTNGKGTTGRFLASALHSMGFKTGHYTSPHILEFNERVWLDGHNVAYDVLEDAHEKLLNILTKEDADALSYFEYTTLLAMLVFSNCDYIVLEAGLGGEYDATSVFKNTLTLVTPIDKDHTAFLGDSIEEIATTKLNAMQSNVILARQKNEAIYGIAKQIAQDKEVNVYKLDELLDENDLENIKKIATNLELAEYLVDNLCLSISALKFLKLTYKISDFSDSKLFGRLSKLNDNIILDVGHNTLAAKSILKSLAKNKYIIVYNSYKDKDYKEILNILKPIINHVEIIDIEGQRAVSNELLQATLKELKIKYELFSTINPHAKYVVFGSFSVAEAFLKVYNE